MRLARLNESLIGKQLARPVQTVDGTVLLRAGIILSRDYINRLRQRNYDSVYIHDVLSQDIVVEEAVAQKTYTSAVNTVKETMRQYREGSMVDIRPVQASVEQLIAEIQTSENVTAGLSSIWSCDEYTFAHSVNVCFFSLILGLTRYYSRDKLHELGVGAMLHDIGKIQTPAAILSKPGSLTAEEYAIIQRHPEDGFNILKKLFSVNLLSAHVAYQHHERFDGKGYPRGLSGDEILETARIVAIADVYDAVTQDRVYKRKVQPMEARRLMLEAEGSQFDGDLLQRFFERVLLYPNGTFVRLNTGEYGIIAQQDKWMNSRPVVRVLTDGEGVPLAEAVELHLSSRPGIKIVDVYDDAPDVLQQAGS